MSVWGPPVLLSSTPGNGSVTIVWGYPPTGPGDLHTDSFTAFTVDGTVTSVTYNSADLIGNSTIVAEVNIQLNTSTDGITFSNTFTNLTNGTLYSFVIFAVNEEYSEHSTLLIVTATPASVPGPVASFTAAGMNGQVNIVFTAPTNNGGAPITGYNIQYGINPSGTGLGSWNYGANASALSITGLANGTLYYFTVAAQNSSGLGPYTTVSATPATNPTIPQNFTGTGINGGVNLSWAAPSNIGCTSIVAYYIQYSTDNATWTQVYAYSGTSSTASFTGLTNGTLYYFQIQAENNAGLYSANTTIFATPSTAPTAVTSLSTTIGNTEVILTWAVPSYNGGIPLSSYNIQYAADSATSLIWLPATPYTPSPATALTYTVTGLTNGTLYYFQVAAVNSSNTGPYTNVTATPLTTPTDPMNLRCSIGDTILNVSWSVPSSNGGSNITGYSLQYGTGSNGPWSPSASLSSSSLSYPISGLTNGTLYYVQVAAVNSVGTGPYSTNSATPSTIPLAPVINSSTSNQDQSSIVSWTVPANGGASITSYNLQYSSSSSAPYQWSSIIPYTLPSSLSSATTLSYTIPGLTNGTLYYFQVAAVNLNGAGPYSSQATNSTQTANTATPSTVPLAPVITSSASNQDQSSTISWTVPTDNGGASITLYNLQYSSSSSAPYQWSQVIPYTLPLSLYSATTLSYSVTGLTNGTLYYFQVAAVNSTNGQGPYSSQATNSTQTANTATPSSIPSAPIITASASNQNTMSTVSWIVPADNGLPITSYNLQYSSSSAPYQWSSVIIYTLPSSLSSATTLSYPIPGLTNGTLYYFQVAAVNLNGQGPYSSQATNSTQTANTATPSTIPTAPVITSSQSNQNTVSTVSWTAPSYNGGASITSYNLQYSTTPLGPGLPSPTTSYNVSASTTTFIFPNLTNGTLYYFQVAAVNLSGQGPYSSQPENSTQVTNTATPSSIPSAPIITSSLSNQNTVSTVSWTAPADNGLPITSYNLQYSTSSSGWLPATPYNVPPTTSYIFQNLTNGTEYFFQVAAVNFNGQGPYSSQPLNSTQVTNSAIPSTTPNAPTILFSVSHQDQMSKVSWAVLNNYDTGGVPIISYSLQYSTSSVGPWLPSLPTTSYNVVAPTTTFIFPNLTNRIQYYFQVAAVNINGTGKYSQQTSTSTAIPSTIPNAPSITSSISNQNQMSTVNWTAPNNDGGTSISSYTLQYSENSFGPWGPIEPYTPSPPTSLTYTFKGLTNGTPYYFQVAAVNSSGRSRYSSQLTNSSQIANSATPSTTPGAPIINSSTSYQNKTSTVNWTAPSDTGGLPITSYNLQYSTDSLNWLQATVDNLPSTTTSYTITSLTNGTLYYFRVAAVNLNGTGTYSSQPANSTQVTNTATPSTVPDAPVILSSASNQNTVSTVNWAAPTNNGGALILSYNLQYSTKSVGPWSSTIPYTPSPSTALTYVFPNLINGTPYYFQVAAVNSSGQGIYSLYQPANSTATPSTAPSAPTINSATTYQNTISTINWTAPSDNGGAPISSYNLQYSSSSTPYQWSQVISYTPPPPSPSPTPPSPTTDFSYTIPSLTNGILYYFQVAAVNLTNGPGAYSQQTANSRAMPSTIPTSPFIISSLSNQNTISTVSWTAPSYNGGVSISISSYNLQYSSTSSTGPWSPAISYTPLPDTALTYTFTGLTNGTQYYFQVAAVNLTNGPGPYSSQPANSTQITNTATPSTVPTAPFITSSTSNQNTISTVNWAAPSYNGGALITSYNLQYSSTSSTGPWSSAISYTPLPDTALTYTFTGLTNGILYYFQVAAVNLTNGPGPYSSQPTNSTQITNTATPSTIPSPPTDLYGDGSSDNGIIYLSWSAPDDDGGSAILSYNLQYCISSTGMWIQMPSYTPSSYMGLSYTFSGLTNGIQYDFQVSALNINGESSYSTTSAIPSTTPEPPVITVLTPYSNQTITVMWNIPYDGGDPISSYDLQYGTSASGPWVSVSPSLQSTQLTYTFNNLTNDIEYYFQIAAINDNGYGSYSSIVNDTPSVTPKPPSLITATKITSSSIALSWTAPSLPSTSGNQVTEYNIQWTDLSSNNTNNTNSGKSSTTTYIITDLRYATQYGIQISSINGSGIGALSDPPVYFTTLSNLPSAPTNLSMTGCNTGYYNSTILKWVAPHDDGSSPIKNYIIYYRPTDNPTNWNTHSTNSSATTATIKVTSTNILYDFKIAAENSAGVGVFSYTINGSSNNPPSPPTNLVASTTESGLIVLIWGESVQNPPESISYYFIEYKINSFGGWTRFKVNIPGDVAEVILDDPNIANNVLYLFRVYAVNSAGAQSDSSNIASATSYNNSLPMYLWSRFSPNCGSNGSTTTNPFTDNLERQMLRKASVLQYFNTGALNFTTKQRWAMAARNGLTRKKGYATQTQDYTNPNTTNMTNPTVPNIGLKEVNNSLTCWTPQSSVICNLTSASNVPGTVKPLCFSLKAPYNNYRNPKTMGSGGTKLMFLY